MTDADVSQAAEAPTLGVVGAGLMGGGIAAIAAISGMNVRVFDLDPEMINSLPGRIRDGYAGELNRGNLTPRQLDTAIDRIAFATSLEEVASADAVIEAVVENLDIKQDVFRILSLAAADHTLLATNTSAISVTEIAAKSSRPEQIVGMHFFSPVRLMRLCEIVRGYRTSDAALASALALSGRLGKEHIVVERDDAGFVTSRLMSVLIHEAARIVEQGLASPEDVDRACVLGFGHSMGPLATADLAGVDISYRAGLAVAQGSGDQSYQPPQLLRRMVAAGDLGRKSGRGFFEYREVNK